MNFVEIDFDDRTPPFEQIKASVIGLIAAGSLPVGHQLPPIRQLAGDLGVAPNTVARAYRELEADGLVRSRGRRGTVVLGEASDAASESPEADAIGSAVSEARKHGLSAAEILRLVTRALAK